MNTNPFYRFINLVLFDRSLLDLEKQQQALMSKIENIDQQSCKREQSVDEAQMLLSGLCRERDILDLDIASHTNRKNKTELRLVSVSNPREYESLKNELTTLVNVISESEDKLVVVWESIEKAENSLRASREAFSQEVIALNNEREALQIALSKVENELDGMRDDRGDLCTDIPVDWLGRYDSMRQNVPNPVVPVENSTCTGCFSQVPTGKKDELRRHVLVICQGCHRILYEL